MNRLKYAIIFFLMLSNIRLAKADNLIHLGTNYGGWTIPEKMINKDSICYCFGAGEDISFEIELINTYQCDVWCFDPTPRSIHHIQKLIEASLLSTPFYTLGPENYKYPLSGITQNKLHFFPLGLWDKDERVKFFSPQTPAHVSHSIVNLQNTHNYFEAPCKKISTIMNELGHSHLDLLKIDIEGAEYRVIKNIIDEKIFPNLFCIEFHSLPNHNITYYCNLLIDSGYQLISTVNMDYLFIRK